MNRYCRILVQVAGQDTNNSLLKDQLAANPAPAVIRKIIAGRTAKSPMLVTFMDVEKW